MTEFPRAPLIFGRAADESVVDEALAAHRRYVLEFIEGHGFCPWAEPARKAGHVQEVLWLEPLDTDVFIAESDAWAEDPSIEVVLVVLPLSTATPTEHEQAARRLRDHDASRRTPQAGVFAIASFHPQAQADASTPQRLIPWLRRSPMPSLQLVRRSVLEALRQTRDAPRYLDPAHVDFAALMSTPTAKPLHEQIAERNLETARRVGLDRLEAELESIRRSRR